MKPGLLHFALLMAAFGSTAILSCWAGGAALHHGHAANRAKAAAQSPIQPLHTGSILSNVPGKLIPQMGCRYPTFEFIKPPKAWPRSIRLLPCLALQTMEAIEKVHTDFVISGMLTQYHHQLYVLPEADVRLFRKHAQASAAASPSATSKPATAKIGQNTSAQNVLNRLLSHHLSRPLQQLVHIQPMLTAKPIPDLPQPIQYAHPPALREGSFIWNRAGRLLFNQPLHEWIFVFQADGPGLSEPPLVLLPCRLLQRMETRSARVGTEIKFRVSGKITQFKGRNYLFIIYVKVAHNLGRF